MPPSPVQNQNPDLVTSAGLKESWTLRGLDNAVKLLLSENNTLFQSLTKNLSAYPALKAAIRSILMEGTRADRCSFSFSETVSPPCAPHLPDGISSAIKNISLKHAVYYHFG